MARITPTLGTEVYRGVQGNRRKVVVPVTISGTYNSASASAGGAYLAASAVNLQQIDYVVVSPTFTADTIEEQPLSVGAATGTGENGWVFALTNKDDDLETADAATVTGVTFLAEIHGF